MKYLKSFSQFLVEQHDINDPDISDLRRHMLDVFIPLADGDKEKEQRVNDIVSTIVVASNKQLRMDEDYLDELAKLLGMEKAALMKKMTEELESFYGQFQGKV